MKTAPHGSTALYPSDLIIQRYNWSGAYRGGWLNSWLGQRGVVRTTLGTDGELGYNYLAQGDDIYLYTGVSSVTADSSNVGFILVNQRTGESHYYPVAGATEDSAQASAEGQVQNLKYEATYPLLLNVAGQPTYFMALKDNAGLVKMYAMINVEHYQSVATGSTVASTQESYLQMLATSGALSEMRRRRAVRRSRSPAPSPPLPRRSSTEIRTFTSRSRATRRFTTSPCPICWKSSVTRSEDSITFNCAKAVDGSDGAAVRSVTKFGASPSL
ncbi:MAG: hypothetical protein ACLTSX_02050 [Collinsella sp.]